MSSNAGSSADPNQASGLESCPDRVRSDESQSPQTEQLATDGQTNVAKPEVGRQSREPPKLVLKLNYLKRKLLMANLDDLSAILQHQKSLSDVAMKRTHEKINESVQLLMDLPPFKTTQSASASSSINQLNFELSGDEQRRLIGHLIANQNALKFFDKIPAKTKRNLAKKNKKIVIELLNLLDRVQYDDDLRSGEDKNEENGEPSEPLSKVGR